jgi:superfamily I DNA and/or RNA helicase
MYIYVKYFSKLTKLDDLISKLSDFISTSIEEYVFNPPNPPNSSSKKIKREQDASFGDNNKSSSIHPTTINTFNYALVKKNELQIA